MKKIIKILLIITLLFSFWIINVEAEETRTDIWDADVSTNQYDQRIDSNNKKPDNWLTNSRLDQLWDWTTEFIKTNVTWEAWIYYTILKIAQSLKNIFLALATVYFLVTVLKLLFSEWSSDDEWEKFKKWFKWITVWIIVMQLAYAYVKVIYNKKIGAEIAGWITWTIVEPLVKLLETAAAFFFIAIMIFSFYKLVTAGWEEEKAKEWKKSVAFAIVWLLIIKLAHYFVSATYSKTICKVDWVSCVDEQSLSDWAQIIFTIINWLNWFVWIAVVLMIIYTGSQIIFSWWEDDKIKKAKKSIIYIIIWIVILIMNYFILTFFFTPELLK